MTRPASTLLFLPAILGPTPGLSARCASGVLLDLAEGICRLGDLRARALGGEGDTSWERGELSGSDPNVLAALVAGRAVELVSQVRFERKPDGIQLQVDLMDLSGSVRWSGNVALKNGDLFQARLALAANLIEAATGRRRDIRRGLLGGSKVLEAYLRVCESRAPGLPSAERVRLLEDGIALDPDYVAAHLMLADAYDAAGNRDRASQVLAALVRRFPAHSGGRLRYGLALRATGKHQRGLTEVQAALESDPDGTVLFEAGRVAEADGDSETAAVLYRRALERGCVDAELADRMARLMTKEGSPAEAARLWERARKLDPTRPELTGDLALAHARSGNLKLAEDLFLHASESEENRVRFQASKARFLAKRGDYVGVLQAVSRALSLGEPDPELYNLRGEARLALNDPWGARRDFVSALEHQEDSELASSIRTNLARLARGRRGEEVGARFRTAYTLFKKGAVEAKNELQGVIELDSEHWQANLLLGMVYRDGLQWESAARAFGEVVRIVGVHPQAQIEQALAVLALGRGDEALALAQRARVDAPRDVSVLSNLGLILMELGAYDQATEVLAQARVEAPEDPVIVRCIGVLDARRSAPSC